MLNNFLQYLDNMIMPYSHILRCYFVVFAFLSAIASFAQSRDSLSIDKHILNTLRPPYSVADYFLLLPEFLFQYEGRTHPFDARARRLILQSATSDSARLNGVDFFLGALETYKTFMIINTAEGYSGTSFSIAQWTYKTATNVQGKKPGVKTVTKPLIGFCKRVWSGKGSRGEVRFFTFDNNTWKDITSKVFTPVALSEFISWSGIRSRPNLQAPMDYELARSEQAITGRLDMQLLQKMPELQPIASGLERSVQLRTVELRLKDSIFVITNKY